jgi:hypothetical protein
VERREERRRGQQGGEEGRSEGWRGGRSSRVERGVEQQSGKEGGAAVWRGGRGGWVKDPSSIFLSLSKNKCCMLLCSPSHNSIWIFLFLFISLRKSHRGPRIGCGKESVTGKKCSKL